MAIQLFPFVSSGPRGVALLGKRERWGCEAKNIKNQGFAVSRPSVLDKSRLRFPSMRDSETSILRPMPVSSRIQTFCKLTYFAFVICIAIKIDRGRESAGDEVSRVKR